MHKCLTIDLGVEPEIDPGHDDKHAAGHVDGDEVVGELPLEHQVHREAAVLASVGLHVAVAARVALDAEPDMISTNERASIWPMRSSPGQVEALGELDRILVVPEVGDVICGVAVWN